MALSNAQVLTITRAAVLISRHVEALSPFECETIAEIGYRYMRHGQQDTVTTAAEWDVVEAAVAAMDRAQAAAAIRRVAA